MLGSSTVPQRSHGGGFILTVRQSPRDQNGQRWSALFLSLKVARLHFFSLNTSSPRKWQTSLSEMARCPTTATACSPFLSHSLSHLSVCLSVSKQSALPSPRLR